jgi:hypothetical protein
MEKKLIWKEIINKTNSSPFKWKDLKNLPFEDEDVIYIHCVEDSQGEDYYEVSAYREVLETDEEFEKRKQRKLDFEEINRKQRFETYKKLREEFDSEVHKTVAHGIY